MKKIVVSLVLIACSLFLVNCSLKDDEVPTPEPIPVSTSGLFGTWELDFYVENGLLTEEIVCNRQVNYFFASDGTYTKTTFAGDGSANCDTAVILNGRWEDLGGEQYQLTPNGSDVNETLMIKFEDNFSKFTIIFSSSLTEVFVKK